VLDLTASWRLCVVAFLSMTLAGCAAPAAPEPDVTIRHEIAPAPPRVGPATVTLALADAAGAPLSGATVRLEGNMSHPGMEPVFGDATEVAPGRYQAPLELTMAGDWYILVDATLPDGRSVQRQIDVRGVTR
jgi:hypothetical protein